MKIRNSKSNAYASGALNFSAVLIAVAICRLSAAEPEPGFKSIFNGKDLSGWDGDSRFWSVRDEAITGQTTPSNTLPHNMFLIWTNGTPADFELRFSYKIVANNDKSFGDSGVQYRSRREPEYVVAGYQANLMVTPQLTGILYEEKGRGITHQLGQQIVMKADPNDTNKFTIEITGAFGKPDEIQRAFKSNDWNDYVIIARGNHLQHFINGVKTADVTDEDPVRAAKSGVLALQLHRGLPMTVQYRNLRIKEFPPEGKEKETGSGGELNRVEGSWQVASVEAEGERLSAQAVTNIYMIITDHKYEVMNLGVETGGTFEVDNTKTPSQIEIHCTTGADSGSSWPGIYEVNGDELRVCYARRGKKRPTAFSAIDNPSLMMITYKRKQS